MNKILFILNDPPYGTERSYNGLRLAGSLAKHEGQEIRVFLMGDAASCAKAGQSTTMPFGSLKSLAWSSASMSGDGPASTSTHSKATSRTGPVPESRSPPMLLNVTAYLTLLSLTAAARSASAARAWTPGALPPTSWPRGPSAAPSTS